MATPRIDGNENFIGNVFSDIMIFTNKTEQINTAIQDFMEKARTNKFNKKQEVLFGEKPLLTPP